MVYQKNFTEVKYLSVSILKMLPRFSKIMTTIEDKSRLAAFVPYTFMVHCDAIHYNQLVVKQLGKSPTITIPISIGEKWTFGHP